MGEESEARPEPDPPERDQRASEPAPGDEPDSSDSSGPRGNPETDEEALRHHQQEGD
jgi:hypothetical protein